MGTFELSYREIFLVNLNILVKLPFATVDFSLGSKSSYFGIQFLKLVYSIWEFVKNNDYVSYRFGSHQSMEFVLSLRLSLLTPKGIRSR